MRHSRRFGTSYYVEVDFEAIFFHHTGLFEDKEEGQMGRITGEKIECSKHRITPFLNQV